MEWHEGQRATCRHCARPIVWNFDADDGEMPCPFGFWYDAERDTEVCGGSSGDPVEDMWHEPA